MFTQVNEPIGVIVKFSGDKTVPVKLLWGGKEILVKKVNLAYSSRAGRIKLYYFAVSDDVNYYKLQFNSENLQWTLLEAYSD